jgi:tetratricopeptide (TPR) repeat protein
MLQSSRGDSGMRSPVRELEARLTQAKTAGECLNALLELASLHAAEFRNREGLRNAREALNIARARKDTVSIGRALAAATLCHYQRGDYLSTVATGLDAVEAYADTDLPGRSSALQSIALALHCVKAPELAQVTAERAVADARQAQDAMREASARTVLGVILSERGLHKSARREFRGAGALYRREGDTLRLKKATANIGHTYRHQGESLAAAGKQGAANFQWKQARRIYEIALGIEASAADDAIVLGALAECECRLGRLDAAHDFIEAALACRLDTPIIMAPCHLWHARILLAQGDLRGAERACERAREGAQRMEHGDVLAACLTMLSQLNDLQGRFETAHDLERRALEVTLEREAALAAVREQLASLWERYSMPAATGIAHAA